MMTIDQIATKLNINYQVAYGLFSWLKAIGAATTTNPPKTGAKGKPAKLYSLTPEAHQLVGEWLDTIQAMSTEADVSRAQEMEARRKLNEVEAARRAKLKSDMAAAAAAARAQVKAAAEASGPVVTENTEEVVSEDDVTEELTPDVLDSLANDLSEAHDNQVSL